MIVILGMEQLILVQELLGWYKLCDSTVQNLTINNSSTSTSTATSCDSYTWNGTTYTSSGTYTWVGTNVIGCD